MAVLLLVNLKQVSNAAEVHQLPKILAPSAPLAFGAQEVQLKLLAPLVFSPVSVVPPQHRALVLFVEMDTSV